ncbi:hypothetical protein I7I50_04788 [Histoplasma capsulatum G186AR]|uniref:Uncharacterized protein n=1 Tax=Ajellomyces capsulatus TaxID=5037 RepID=A0A8H7YRB2_AJECA|nr:hypothetical protein I7I52_05697 [Histoplasma capsulatum]QSS75602.1 hypothetical protein I7I50_04788 [Histoplasma capsulatum G186AR]
MFDCLNPPTGIRRSPRLSPQLHRPPGHLRVDRVYPRRTHSINIVFGSNCRLQQRRLIQRLIEHIFLILIPRILILHIVSKFEFSLKITWRSISIFPYILIDPCVFLPFLLMHAPQKPVIARNITRFSLRRFDLHIDRAGLSLHSARPALFVSVAFAFRYGFVPCGYLVKCVQMVELGTELDDRRQRSQVQFI